MLAIKQLTNQIQRMQQTWHAILLPQKLRQCVTSKNSEVVVRNLDDHQARYSAQPQW